jgi:hypothetical protein
MSDRSKIRTPTEEIEVALSKNGKPITKQKRAARRRAALFLKNFLFSLAKSRKKE